MKHFILILARERATKRTLTLRMISDTKNDEAPPQGLVTKAVEAHLDAAGFQQPVDVDLVLCDNQEMMDSLYEAQPGGKLSAAEHEDMITRLRQTGVFQNVEDLRGTRH